MNGIKIEYNLNMINWKYKIVKLSKIDVSVFDLMWKNSSRLITL